MSQTKKHHCEPLVAVWLRPSTTEPCICCKQVAEKPRGEYLKNDVCMYVNPSLASNGVRNHNRKMTQKSQVKESEIGTSAATLLRLVHCWNVI